MCSGMAALTIEFYFLRVLGFEFGHRLVADYFLLSPAVIFRCPHSHGIFLNRVIVVCMDS